MDVGRGAEARNRHRGRRFRPQGGVVDARRDGARGQVAARSCARAAWSAQRQERGAPATDPRAAREGGRPYSGEAKGGETIAAQGRGHRRRQAPDEPGRAPQARREGAAPKRRSASPRRSISRRAASPCAARSRSRRWCSTAPSPATTRTRSAASSTRTPTAICACQFTFACDGIPDVVREPDAMGARQEDRGRDRSTASCGCPRSARPRTITPTGCDPSWVREMTKMHKLGVHTFYRPRALGRRRRRARMGRRARRPPRRRSGGDRRGCTCAAC